MQIAPMILLMSIAPERSKCREAIQMLATKNTSNIPLLTSRSPAMFNK